MTRLRGTAALAVLAALVAGVPWALVQFGNWPIHGVPTGEQLRDLGDAVVSDTAVFAVLTVAAWAVWSVFLASLLVEVVAVARGVQAPRLTFAGPVQRSARGLVAAIVLALTIAHNPRPATAGPLIPTATARAAPVATATPPAVEPSPAASPAAAQPASPDGLAKTVTVQRGDSAWSIAETHLGDGMRWRELWDANRAITQPDGRAWTDPQIIRPGWQLRLPDRSTAESATTTDRHTVAAGDTLSGIAQAHLGDPARYVEIFELNRDVAQPDGQRLTDPDLIQPGWSLRLPQGGEPPEPPEVVPDPQPDPAPAAPSPEASAPSPTTTPAPAPASTAPTRPEGTMDARGTARENSSAAGGDSSTPALAGIASALVLATGLAARIAFLRRRRAVRGTRHHPLRAGGEQVIDAVVAAADVPLVRWAGQHLARLIANLDRRHVTGAPVAVELSDTAGIELLWDTPQPDAVAPWTAADGGWAWRLTYDPDAPVPANELPAAIPALITIGQRDGRQLMVDLEAYGTVTVTGDPERVDAFLRATAVELATNQDLADAFVYAVGLDPGITHLDRLCAAGIVDAIHRLDTVRQSVAAALTADRVDGTFAARAGSTTPIDATIVVAHPGSDQDLANLRSAAPPRHGVAVLASAANVEADAPAHIALLGDGSARLDPLGIEFTPVVLPEATAGLLEAALGSLEDLEATRADFTEAHRPDEPRADAAAASADLTGPSGNGHHPLRDGLPAPIPPGPTTGIEEQLLLTPAEDDGLALDEPAMVVEVLGTPTVPDRPGLGRRELILTVLLACRAGPVAASAVQDALWGGKPVESKTVWNVIGATRRALGDLPDGTPVMPPADRARGTLQLAPGVVTDLAQLRGLVERAETASSSEAIGLLREALEFVTGPPFDAAGYDWAHRDQDVAEASTLIEQAAVSLADLALASGQVDVARDGLTRGLRGLPGNEELYRSRLRVEHRAGNLAGVRAAYDELVTYLADLETEPSPATTALYHDLIQPARR